MFKFNFDIETGEAHMSAPQSDYATNSDGKPEQAEDAALVCSNKEPFQEVFPNEAFNSSDSSCESPPICETLGVKHLSAPITSKNDHLFQRAEKLNSDLIPQVYEGGYKIWESTIDLLNVLSQRQELVCGRHVLDLGCGAGVGGLRAVLDGASSVHFHDYVRGFYNIVINASVLANLTIPNFRLLSSTIEVEEKKYTTQNVRFFAGDWTLFKNPMEYDLILTAETIYRRENYAILCDLFDRCLVPEKGQVIVAAKTIYFGVGGSMTEFRDCCLRRGWKVETLFRMDKGGWSRFYKTELARQ
ncbi:histidine protein methyltransferase 1 homolog isoform X1 [Varroa destructor]|uniref:protein-histidine N-methyltransferase n=1 Tax=Varroa destructor TaxID=109461 RepID=A0A7M7KL68_VARDE|nr:histidine protein methyltransferase 1 homolog isoform X1 [Varroa destructor]XP_022668547.1 histidine protein methyltransferase 1 homolog isoform X1 [Varroa destructor]XP_022668548.1 histidine protein methyltransferase 1 homolog isoform X1 [Varroa destructor]XP_022668549.1 histidine protein methyltransferase 1 homolog isoform X1 [Varroa destructor]